MLLQAVEEGAAGDSFTSGVIPEFRPTLTVLGCRWTRSVAWVATHRKLVVLGLCSRRGTLVVFASSGE